MEISMVISTCDRGHLLDQSLRRLTELTIPDELLVIDDGGTDDTEEVCRAWMEHLPIHYIYTHHPGKQICSHARNVGVKAARNEWIVTSEPELCFRTDVLKQFKQLHSQYSQEIISAGKVWFAPDGHKPQFEGDPGWETAGDYTPPKGSQEAIGWVAPYTALWNKGWLVELGGWDEEFPGPWGWDDIDLLTRLRINGHGQYIATEVEAVHLFHGLGGDKNFVNEKYFRSKSFSQGDETDHRDLVANKGRDWGTPIPRT